MHVNDECQTGQLSVNDEQLKKLLDIIKIFSNDIKMEFGLDKCTKATFIKGKLTRTSDIVLNQDTAIKELDREGTYNYLGINEGDGIKHLKKYYRRIRMVLSTRSKH